jgi:hypothetical protein
VGTLTNYVHKVTISVPAFHQASPIFNDPKTRIHGFQHYINTVSSYFNSKIPSDRMRRPRYCLTDGRETKGGKELTGLRKPSSGFKQDRCANHENRAHGHRHIQPSSSLPPVVSSTEDELIDAIEDFLAWDKEVKLDQLLEERQSDTQHVCLETQKTVIDQNPTSESKNPSAQESREMATSCSKTQVSQEQEKSPPNSEEMIYISYLESIDSELWTSSEKQACKFCPSRYFNRKHDLKRHIKSIHLREAEYQCHLCGNEYTRKSHLEAHIVSVHEKKADYICEHCDKGFATLPLRRKHILRVHRKDPNVPMEMD